MLRPFLTSYGLVLSAVALTACPAEEFEKDPDGNGAGGRSATALGGSAGSTSVDSAGTTSVANAGTTSVANAGTTSVSSGGSTSVSSGGSTSVSSGGSTSGGVAGSSSAGTGGDGLVKHLEFERHGALGYCIEENTPNRIELTRGADGLMTAEGSYAFFMPDDGGGCGLYTPKEDSADNCVVSAPMNSITLNQQQQDQLDALLAALPVGECVVDAPCDPCLVSDLDLDGRQETTLCCGAQASAGFDEAFSDIEDFLDALVTPQAPFTQFSLERSPTWNICENLGRANMASLSRRADGSLSLSGTVVHSLIEEDGAACPVGSYLLPNEGACLSTIPDRQLSAEQQDRLEELIGALPVGECEAAPGWTCDFCPITNTFEIDTRTETGNCCGEQLAPGFDITYAAIVSYIDNLMQEPTAGYDHLRFRRSSFIAPECIQAGEPFDVIVERGTEGSFTLSGTYVAAVASTAETCPTETVFVETGEMCLGTLDALELSTEETAELDALVAALPPGLCVNDPEVACEQPCFEPVLELGSARVEERDCCGTQHVTGFYAAFNAVTTYIKGFMP